MAALIKTTIEADENGLVCIRQIETHDNYGGRPRTFNAYVVLHSGNFPELRAAIDKAEHTLKHIYDPKPEAIVEIGGEAGGA